MRSRKGNHAKQRQPVRCESVIEPLESRRLQSATVTSTTTNNINDISGTAVAQIQVGDNGVIGGVPGVAITVAGAETNAADVEWSSDESNGFDSDWQAVQFSVSTGAAGTTSLAVQEAPTISSPTATSGTLSQVTITASVDGWGMSMDWQGITANFYDGTTLLGSEQIGQVVVDTTNANTNDPQQATATISTNFTNCTSIVVDAEVQMYSVPGVYPGETDIAGGIAIS